MVLVAMVQRLTQSMFMFLFVLKEGRRYCVTPEPQPHYSRTGNDIIEI